MTRIITAAGGMCFVLWLLYAELEIIHRICLWCSSVHVVTFVLFVLTITSAPGVLARTERSVA